MCGNRRAGERVAEDESVVGRVGAGTSSCMSCIAFVFAHEPDVVQDVCWRVSMSSLEP